VRGKSSAGSVCSQEGYSGTGVSGCKRSHSRDDRHPAQRGNAIFHISADGAGRRSSPGPGRSRATAAGADEPHHEQHRCDEGWHGRASYHQVAAIRNEHLLVSVSEPAWGCPRSRRTRSSMRFFTTKPDAPHGLRISRSIVESHGGALWAADNSLRGASFTSLYQASRGTGMTPAGAPTGSSLMTMPMCALPSKACRRGVNTP